MTPRATRSAARTAGLLATSALAAVLTAGLGLAVVALMISAPPPGPGCSGATGATGAAGAQAIDLSAGAGGQRAGATEYGGPGDPSSGSVGASGANLLAHPDSYAELGGETFQTARAMGGLAYMTPLRVTWGDHSAIAYKRDFGLGGGPVAGLPRVIDLWWQFAGALGIPYEHGLWSGPVSISRPPAAGAGNLLASSPAIVDTAASVGVSTGCTLAAAEGVPLTGGSRAKLLPDGQAAAPAGAPAAVRGIIAAGNQIVGKPYLYGGGHGLALDQVSSTYDCSSSVEHLLYGGRLLPVTYDAASGELESFGGPGPGRWVTIYASADHVFMYVAGLRWDTHNDAGSGDGSAGIGWHPLVRESAGFVERHPAGL